MLPSAVPHPVPEFPYEINHGRAEREPLSGAGPHLEKRVLLRERPGGPGLDRIENRRGPPGPPVRLEHVHERAVTKTTEHTRRMSVRHGTDAQRPISALFHRSAQGTKRVVSVASNSGPLRAFEIPGRDRDLVITSVYGETPGRHVVRPKDTALKTVHSSLPKSELYSQSPEGTQ